MIEENNGVQNDMSVVQKHSMFDKVVFGLLVLLSAIVPVFFVPATFVSTQFGTSLLFGFGVIIAFVVYLLSSLVRGEVELPSRARYILSFGAVVPVVYFLAGISNGFSRMTFLGYTFDVSTVGFVLSAFVYMFLVSVIFKNQKRILYGYYAFGVPFVITSVWLIIRLIFGADVLSFGLFPNINSTIFGSWNNVAIFFGISTIISFIGCHLLKVSRVVKVLLNIVLLVSVFFVALTNFYASWFLLAIVSFLYTLYSLFTVDVMGGMPMEWKARFRKIPVYPVIILVLSLVFVIWSSSAGAFLSNKLKVTNVEVRPSFSVTMEIAKQTIKSKPLFGSGPNTFITQWLVYRPGDILTTIFWNTDFANGIGIIPTFAVTTGLLGILSWILFLGSYLYLGVKSIFTRFDDVNKKYFLVTSFFVSLYLWIMTFVYVPSSIVFILTFFFSGLFLASVYSNGIISLSTKKLSANPRVGFISSLITVSFIAMALTLGYGLIENYRSLWFFQKSSYALNTTKDSKLSKEYMQKAISTAPMDVYYRALSEIELYRLNEIVSQDPKKVTVEDVQKQFKETLDSAIVSGIGARDIDPSNYLNWIALGKVYETVSVPQINIQGAYESASSAYGEALRRNPKNPAIFMLLARLAGNRNDLRTAESYVMQAIQAKNNYLDAYFLLSQIQVANKNIQGAINSVTATSIIDPTNPAIFFQLGLLKYNIGDFVGAIGSLEKAISLAPDYANAKYFLGLSYEITKQHEKAIKEFQDLAKTNSDSQEVKSILDNLLANKPIFTSPAPEKPEKSKTLPLKENQ